MRCAAANDLWFGPGAWMPPMHDRVCRLLGLPPGARREDATKLLSDEAIDLAAARHCLGVLRDWNTKGGREGADALAAMDSKRSSKHASTRATPFSERFLPKAPSPSRKTSITSRNAMRTTLHRQSNCFNLLRRFANI